MPATVYEDIGGKEAVTAAVNEFYDRVLHDDFLASKFEGVNLARLKRHQVDFLSVALGGDAVYSGGDLADVHQRLNISDEEFERVIDHLIATLLHLGVPHETVARIGQNLMPLRDSIVSDSI
jgi:hemoglobin